MVKYSLSIVLFFFGISAFAQVANLLPEMNETSADYTFFSVDENQAVYRFKGVYAAFFENKYKVYDVKTGVSKDVEVESVNYKGAEGLVVNYLIKNNQIYELLLFKASKTNTITYNAIVVRDLRTFKQIGSVVVFDEIQAAYMGAGQGLQMLESESGFYVLAGSKYLKRHYLKHFSNEANEEWFTNIDALDVPNSELKNASVANNDDVLLTIVMSGVTSATNGGSSNFAWRNKALKFVHISSEGEATTSSAQMDGDLTVQAYDFNYNSDKKEIVGILSITKSIDPKKNETSGVGYAYMVWDLEGNLLKSHDYYLTYKDLDGKELQHFIELTKVKKGSIESGKELPTISMGINFEAFFLNDGSVIVGHDDFKDLVNGYAVDGGTFENSNLIYCIDPNGELKWTHFYPNDLLISYPVNSYVQNDDKLYIYSKFSTDNFGQFYSEYNSLASTFGAAKGLLLMERILDVATGEMTSFKPLIESPLESFAAVNFYKRDDVLLFEYQNSKKNKMRLAVVK